MTPVEGKPFVTGAAIRYNKDQLVLVGAHHGDAIRIRAMVFGEKSVIGINCEDGFVLNTGRFVTREEAKQVAIEAGQLSTDHKGTLYSEDLWG